MKVSLRIGILMIVLLLAQALSACGQPAPQSPDVSPANVTMPGTEVKQIESTATGRSYDIYVRLPEEYAQDQKKQYPILYVLDGQWDFKLLDSIYGGLHYDEFVPEMIIVGITYSGASPDYNALRAMDYTPVHDPSIPGSGDAPKFLAFLKEELFPFIETSYRVERSERILMGSSFGGTFTLYALFSEPELFRAYVAASPAVPYGDNFAFKQEAEYSGKHADLPVRLFLSVGELEPLASPVMEFMQTLSGRSYAGLEWETRIIEGERHAGNKPEAYNRGLRFVFQADVPHPVSASQPTGTPGSNTPPDQTKNDSYTLAEAEGLAGFDVRQPAYLPQGVSFDFATYEKTPYPAVTLHFKLFHEQYGDMGPFFMISQELRSEAPAEATACGEPAEGCEVLQIDNVPVVYRLYASPSGDGGNTEGFTWYADGFFFRLHRMAGEPGKVYKEELLKVVGSLK